MQTNTSLQADTYVTERPLLLVIEDNDDIWLIISLLLKRQLPNVNFHRVVNAQQALDYLDKSMMRKRQ